MSSEMMYQQAMNNLESGGSKESAIVMLNRLIESYPKSDEAERAKHQIARIKSGEVDVNDAALEPNVVLTTSFQLEGFRIKETLEIVAAECTFGMNILQDLMAGIRDVFGGRSKVTQKALREARKLCLRELKFEADAVGANAVIAVTLNYSEFSGQGKSMLFLVASGTAVVVEPFPEYRND